MCVFVCSDVIDLPLNQRVFCVCSLFQVIIKCDYDYAYRIINLPSDGSNHCRNQVFSCILPNKRGKKSFEAFEERFKSNSREKRNKECAAKISETKEDRKKTQKECDALFESSSLVFYILYALLLLFLPIS